MFYYVDGTVSVLQQGLAVIDCGGVGYACHASQNTIGKLKTGEKARLLTWLNVREGVFELYGFIDEEEKSCFLMLTSVNGVGPKAALSILSVAPPDRLALSIITGDEKMLMQAPGIGKKIAQRIVLELRDKMSKEQLVNRMLSMESRVDSQKLRTGTLSDSDWDAVVEGIGVIGNSKLIIDDTPGISIMELRSKCRKMKLEHGLSIVIIDYLQLMSGSGKGGENRQQEISEISRSLKALARELNAPVIALSQLSRACETRQDHRPMLSDLRESGAIEQDADVVMFLYRDDYYNKDTDTPNIAEVIIAKQRNGPIGTIQLMWRPELTKFANLAR